MKVFISQCMAGKTNEEIILERSLLVSKLENKGYQVIDSVLNIDANPVYLLGKSIELLSEADFIYLMPGWENGRGCRIEKLVADNYEIPILEEV